MRSTGTIALFCVVVATADEIFGRRDIPLSENLTSTLLGKSRGKAGRGIPRNYFGRWTLNEANFGTHTRFPVFGQRQKNGNQDGYVLSGKINNGFIILLSSYDVEVSLCERTSAIGAQ